MTVSAIVDEGRLQRRLNAGYFSEIDIAAELLTAGDSKSNSSTRLPWRTTTRVSSGWAASMSILFGMAGVSADAAANPGQRIALRDGEAWPVGLCTREGASGPPGRRQAAGWRPGRCGEVSVWRCAEHGRAVRCHVASWSEAIPHRPSGAARERPRADSGHDPADEPQGQRSQIAEARTIAVPASPPVLREPESRRIPDCL